MVFVHPSWVTGTLVWVLFCIPLILCILFTVFSAVKFFIFDDNSEKWLKLFFVGSFLSVFLVFVTLGGGGYLWHEMYEVPSVDSKVVTVEGWQVKPNAVHTEKGMMVVDNADQLMLITTDGEGFYNNENFLFQKFDTRDILNKAKPGSKINVTYYGWREGYNSGFPNILSVEVIDDSNATDVKLSDYFGTKLSLQ